MGQPPGNNSSRVLPPALADPMVIIARKPSDIRQDLLRVLYTVLTLDDPEAMSWLANMKPAWLNGDSDSESPHSRFTPFLTRG